GNYAIQNNPERYVHSTSGEIRLSRPFREGDRLHTLFFTTRARDRTSTFGGGDLRQFGFATIGAFPDLPEPTFNPGIPTKGETRQVTAGIGYEGVWPNVGQLSLAVQKSAYERAVTQPNGAAATGKKSPWLFNMGGAAYLSPALAVYASYTRGL